MAGWMVGDSSTPRLLTDGEHWSVQPARQRQGCLLLFTKATPGPSGFDPFFRALRHLAPEGSFLALECGSLAPEERAVLSALSRSPSAELRERAGPLSDDAVVVDCSAAVLDELLGLADRHAEPEIAMELCAFTEAGPWLQWYDAPDDPISLSAEMPREVVERFAAELGGTCNRIPVRR